MIVLLDTGVLGMLCHASRQPPFQLAWYWLERLRGDGHVVIVPEIADYELRRELLRMGRLESAATLDRLGADLRYDPITTTAMRQAASLWASSRQAGRLTGHDHALDGDVILAAQTLELIDQGHRCVVATTNVRHLSWYVDARQWETITPESLSV